MISSDSPITGVRFETFLLHKSEYLLTFLISNVLNLDLQSVSLCHVRLLRSGKNENCVLNM